MVSGDLFTCSLSESQCLMNKKCNLLASSEVATQTAASSSHSARMKNNLFMTDRFGGPDVGSPKVNEGFGSAVVAGTVVPTSYPC